MIETKPKKTKEKFSRTNGTILVFIPITRVKGIAVMKCKILFIILSFLTATASAQLASGRFTTSFYGWQGRNA